MTYFMYTFMPILAFGLMGGIIRFKMYKTSVSTTVITIAFAVCSMLFYFGMTTIAMILMTVAVLVLYFRALRRSPSDTLWDNNYDGRNRRHKHASF